MNTDELVRELETLAGPEPVGDDAWCSTMRRVQRRRRSTRVVASLAVAVVVIVAVAFVSNGASDGSRTTVSSGGSSAKPKGYYKATTTLVVDLNRNADTSGGMNIDQIALFTTRGDVPDAVAESLGEKSGHRLATRITTKTDRRTSTVAITAVARTAREAERLANTFGAELVRVVDQKIQSSYGDARDLLQRRLDDLSNSINALIGQIAANPPNTEQLSAQLRALQNQYSMTYDSYSQLATEGSPRSRFTILEKAQAVSIDKDEYDARTRDR